MFSSNTSGDGRYVVDVRFLNHRSHSLLDRTLTKLEFRVLIPDSFEIEIWTSDQGLQEG